MITEKRTEIIRDVQFYWAKLDNPVDPFKTGTPQWELQIRTEDEAKAKELTDKYYLSMKKVTDDGEVYWKTNLKRKSVNKDGNALEPPVVVNGNKQPIDSGSIGNGSTGNVMLFQYPYDVAGRKGVASQLSRVQVINLVPYSPSTGTDFDVVDSPSNETAQVDF
jgi:hypothetical protein